MFQDQRDQFDAFQKRHPGAIEILGRITVRAYAMHTKCNKGLSNHQLAVMAMAHMALDDFYELVFVGTHGEGFAAQKLLRSMFERVVTLRYLTKHPERLDDYLTYSAIETSKLMRALEESFGPGVFTSEQLAVANQEAKDVADRYVSSACPGCGAKRPAMSWAGALDFHAMAHDAGLAKLVGPAYVVPLGHAHPKPLTYLQRLEGSADGRAFTSVGRLSAEQADQAMSTAHLLALVVLDNSNVFFQLGENLEDLMGEFGSVWGRPPEVPTDAGDQAGAK